MRIESIHPQLLKSTSLKKGAQSLKTANVATMAQNSISVSSRDVLCQFPNISFGKLEDDLSKYQNYDGGMTSEIELEKFAISKQVAQSIEYKDYFSAIKGKIDLARICREQGKEEDCYFLEQGIRRLYAKMPESERYNAWALIYYYNNNMARFIEKDIAEML